MAAGVALGSQVAPSPNIQMGNLAGQTLFVSDNVGLSSLCYPTRLLNIDSGDGIEIRPTHGIRRLDGRPLHASDLYMDDDGVIQLRQDSEQIDFDWYSPWL